jgi:hypothetical protein
MTLLPSLAVESCATIEYDFDCTELLHIFFCRISFHQSLSSGDLSVLVDIAVGLTADKERTNRSREQQGLHLLLAHCPSYAYHLTSTDLPREHGPLNFMPVTRDVGSKIVKQVGSDLVLHRELQVSSAVSKVHSLNPLSHKSR